MKGEKSAMEGNAMPPCEIHFQHEWRGDDFVLSWWKPQLKMSIRSIFTACIALGILFLSRHRDPEPRPVSDVEASKVGKPAVTDEDDGK